MREYHHDSRLLTLNAIALVLGLALWLTLYVALEELGLIEKLLLFAALGTVPLAMRAIYVTESAVKSSALYRLLFLWQLPAAALLALSFRYDPGTSCALLALPWILQTLFLAGLGLRKLLEGRFAFTEEMGIAAGLLYISVGGAWLFCHRLGMNPLGFADVIVLLTAVHFHYAGFAAPILAGFLGRLLHDNASTLEKRLYKATLMGTIASPALLAAGITFSPFLEIISAAVYALSLILLAGLNFWTLRKGRILDRGAPLFLAVSSMSVVAAMILALLYAYSEFSGANLISIPEMARTHGLFNALGFVFCGLWAWSAARPEPV